MLNINSDGTVYFSVDEDIEVLRGELQTLEVVTQDLQERREKIRRLLDSLLGVQQVLHTMQPGDMLISLTDSLSGTLDPTV